MIHNIQNKTLRWSFIKSIEPARVVHARVTDIITQDNLFAQITVRFHTQQVIISLFKTYLFLITIINNFHYIILFRHYQFLIVLDA